MDKKNIITKEGRKELLEELDKLVNIERQKTIEEIKDARALGDLSENTEFDAAREKQGKIEDRISEIERILESSKIIKTNKTKNGHISIGTIVNLLIGKNKHTYQIVGPLEADPFEGKISNVSPLGSAILGKKNGDKISLTIENGKKLKKLFIKIQSIEN